MFPSIKKLIKKHPLKTLVLLGLLIRLALLFLDFSFDVNSYIAWAKEAIKFGLPGFYEKASVERYGSVFPNYPPFSIFLFIIFYQLYQLVFFVAWKINLAIPFFPSKIIYFLETRAALAGFMKLAPVFFDIGLALLIYQFAKKIIKQKTSRLPLFVAAAILFNPGFFYNSGYMGQIESIPLFFLLASFYVVFFAHSPFWSLPLFTLALLSKQTVVIFFPLVILLIIKKRSWPVFWKSALLSLIIFWLSFLFFYKQGNLFFFPIKIYLTKILFAPGLPFASNHAYNFWALVTRWRNIRDTTPFLFFNYQLWGYILAGCWLLVVGYWLIKKRSSTINVLNVAALLALTVFLFLTKIHERHLQQALPFLLLAGLRDKKFLIGFFYFSLVYFINIYHNWPVPKIVTLEYLIKLPAVVNVFIIASLIFYLFLIKDYLSSKS